MAGIVDRRQTEAEACEVEAGNMLPHGIVFGGSLFTLVDQYNFPMVYDIRVRARDLNENDIGFIIAVSNEEYSMTDEFNIGHVVLAKSYERRNLRICYLDTSSLDNFSSGYLLKLYHRVYGNYAVYRKVM